MPLKNAIKAFKTYLGDKESLLDTNYRSIADMIELHWGYKEFYLYINKILTIEQGTKRQSLPPEVLKEIHALQEIHEKIFPGMKQRLMNENNISAAAGKHRDSLRL